MLLVCSLCEDIVILTVVSDNFCGLEAASSHSNCTDGMNSWAAESLPVVWMPGGMVVVEKTSQDTTDLARTTAGFLQIWSTVPLIHRLC